MTQDVTVKYLPYVCEWKDCTRPAIMRKWFREAGRREFNLCAKHAEMVSELLWKAREYERNNNPPRRVP